MPVGPALLRSSPGVSARGTEGRSTYEEPWDSPPCGSELNPVLSLEVSVCVRCGGEGESRAALQMELLTQESGGIS